MLLPPKPDPFLQQMFARMSPGAKFTFTPAQIDEIKKAFSARSRTSHALDVRRSIRLFGSSYYVVFLAGRERRPVSRQAVPAPSQLVAAGCLAAVCCLFVAAFFRA